MSIRRRRNALTAAVRRPPAPALLLASIVGWAAMVWLTAMAAAQSADSALGPAATVHGAHSAGAVAAPHGLTLWLAMFVAMSPLLLMREIGRLWAGSLRRLRAPTVLAFASGYAAVWIVAGAVAVPLAAALGTPVWPGAAAAAGVLVWHCSPLRRRLLNACHRVPRLRVFGADAIADAGRYGVLTGAACAASCGPIMLLVLVATDFHLLAMIAATALLTAERYRPVRRPRWRLPFMSAAPEHVALGPRTQTGRELSWRSR